MHWIKWKGHERRQRIERRLGMDRRFIRDRRIAVECHSSLLAVDAATRMGYERRVMLSKRNNTERRCCNRRGGLLSLLAQIRINATLRDHHIRRCP